MFFHVIYVATAWRRCCQAIAKSKPGWLLDGLLAGCLAGWLAVWLLASWLAGWLGR